jgi:hypothetical protein
MEGENNSRKTAQEIDNPESSEWFIEGQAFSRSSPTPFPGQ